ncbi:MAG: deoxynucleoside kinase [Candidatus Pacebacteria bacterium]|nr:deoxynucleoside kinase [Candidatus Paceibacterota bacterium]
MTNKNNGIIIAIVGPHYSGKSTLSQKLFHESNFSTVEEKWLEDPFTQFRKKGDYLKSQIWFLTETMKTMLEAINMKNNGSKIVLDTFVNTTRAFCRSKLSTQDFKIFNIVFDNIVKDFPLPDLIIYLTGSVDALKQRSIIRAKSGTGPDSDKNVSLEWIKKSIDANEEEFGNWTKTPIIKIDVSNKDVINNKLDYNELLQKVINTQN